MPLHIASDRGPDDCEFVAQPARAVGFAEVPFREHCRQDGRQSRPGRFGAQVKPCGVDDLAGLRVILRQQAAPGRRQKRCRPQNAGNAIGRAKILHGNVIGAQYLAGDPCQQPGGTARIGEEGIEIRNFRARSARSNQPAFRAWLSGVAISCFFSAPSTTSRHQVRRISASIGSLATSRARASSWLKAYSSSSRSRFAAGANRLQKKRSGSARLTCAISALDVVIGSP